MKSIIRMVLVLGAVCAVAALGLSSVYEMTKQPIADALRKELLDAVTAVLPEYDNAPDADAVEADSVTYYIGKKDGAPVGAAFRVETMEGYSGYISALVGVDASGTVTGVRILTHAETPGLGAKFTDPGFLSMFKGKTLDGAKWKVDKDGGEFDSITGATITPRALVTAVAKGLEGYRAANIFAAGEEAK